jgi:hypothetical protein
MNIYKQLLREFWFEVSGRGYKKTLCHHVDEKVKLDKLIEFSKYYHGNGSAKRELREEFNRIKFVVKSVRITPNSECFVCRGKAECRHHIIQLQNGGINLKENIVHLCNKCHSDIHPWLKNNML